MREVNKISDLTTIEQRVIYAMYIRENIYSKDFKEGRIERYLLKFIHSKDWYKSSPLVMEFRYCWKLINFLEEHNHPYDTEEINNKIKAPFGMNIYRIISKLVEIGLIKETNYNINKTNGSSKIIYKLAANYIKKINNMIDNKIILVDKIEVIEEKYISKNV